jgi:hypothetical protein
MILYRKFTNFAGQKNRSTMDFRFLYNRIKYIVLNPSKAWSVIHDENRPVRDVRNSFFIPLAVIVAMCSFLGSIIFTNSTLSPVYSLIIALKFLILHLLVVFTSAVIFGEITKALDLGKNYTVSFKIIAYSVSPLLICQMISHLFESLIFVNILSLYGLYIFWVGTEKMLNPPEHKKMPMLVATFVVVAGLYIAGTILLTSIADKIYFGNFA